MHRRLCAFCFSLGFCRYRTSPIVTDAEISDPEWVRDFRAYLAGLDISPDQWRDTLADWLRDLDRRIVGRDGREVEQDMAVFEPSPKEEERAWRDGRPPRDSIKYWFRGFCRKVPPHVHPRVRIEARERVRVFASIIRARDPDGTAHFGLRAANDNHPI